MPLERERLETLLCEAQDEAHDLALRLAESLERESLTLDRKADALADYLRLLGRCNDWFNAVDQMLTMMPVCWTIDPKLARLVRMVKEGACPSSTPER